MCSNHGIFLCLLFNRALTYSKGYRMFSKYEKQHMYSSAWLLCYIYHKIHCISQQVMREVKIPWFVLSVVSYIEIGDISTLTKHALLYCSINTGLYLHLLITMINLFFLFHKNIKKTLSQNLIIILS